MLPVWFKRIKLLTTVIRKDFNKNKLKGLKVAKSKDTNLVDGGEDGGEDGCEDGGENDGKVE